MIAGTIPIKTPEGQAELSARQRSVSQRHRTVLFLVDGRRSAPDVRSLAMRAGVPDTCFDDLLELGMIALPAPAAPAGRIRRATANVAAFDAFDADGGLDSDHIDLPMFEPSSSAMLLDSTSTSTLPPARSLFPDDTTTNGGLGPASTTDPWRRSDGPAPAARNASLDAAFDVAQQLLVRAVRAEAPLAGSLTLLRLRRARTRAELHGLLGEVEARIAKPHRALAAAQTIRRARELLEGRIDSSVELL